MTRVSAVLLAFAAFATTHAFGEAAAPASPAPTPEYRLVWADEFDVDGPPDATKWTYEHGFVRNRELQWYQPEIARCEGGRLIIEARRESKPNPRHEAG